VSRPYPAEDLKSTPDLSALKQAALITGGAAQPKAADVYARAGESIQFHKDLWPYVLMVVAKLFVVDVFLRRVRLFGYRAVKF
jgi:hypothetical protein